MTIVKRRSPRIYLEFNAWVGRTATPEDEVQRLRRDFLEAPDSMREAFRIEPVNGDINFSWPTGELAVMGAGGAVNIIHRNQLKDADDPDQLRADLVKEYEDRLINPYVAAGRGLIDDVIDPSETRQKVIRALAMLDNKREVLPPKKHGSIPL